MQGKQIIIAITSASGSIYGIRILEVLKELNYRTHLIISKAAHITITSETKYKISDLKKLANEVYLPENIGAKIASGSFLSEGMIIAPCSIRTMSAIATGNTDNLISRAADVILKEKRKLVLMVRETPLHLGHLRNMALLSEIGAIIAPPMPAFYTNPQTIDDIVDNTIGRILDLFYIENDLAKRWKGE